MGFTEGWKEDPLWKSCVEQYDSGADASRVRPSACFHSPEPRKTSIKYVPAFPSRVLKTTKAPVAVHGELVERCFECVELGIGQLHL